MYDVSKRVQALETLKQRDHGADQPGSSDELTLARTELLRLAQEKVRT